jgi:arsenate reductase
MAERYTVYEKPTCSTCRQVMNLFQERGIAYDAINYIVDPPSVAVLQAIVAGINVEPRALVRTKEPAFKALNIVAESLTAAAVVALLAEHPALLQRPIIGHEGAYVLGRPADAVAQFLDSMK